MTEAGKFREVNEYECLHALRRKAGGLGARNEELGCFVGSLLTGACADSLQHLQIMSNFEFRQTMSLNIQHIEVYFSHSQIIF